MLGWCSGFSVWSLTLGVYYILYIIHILLYIIILYIIILYIILYYTLLFFLFFSPFLYSSLPNLLLFLPFLFPLIILYVSVLGYAYLYSWGMEDWDRINVCGLCFELVDGYWCFVLVLTLGVISYLILYSSLLLFFSHIQCSV